MGLAFALITVGGILAYSGFKGVSVADVLAGIVGDPLNPKGGNMPHYVDPNNNPNDPQSTNDENKNPSGLPVTNKWGFKGPHASKLAAAATMAESYGLTITSVAGGVHVPTSWHYQHRAFDASGKASDMSLFAKWLVANFPDALEIFYDPDIINIKNGRANSHPQGGHSDHVHFAY